MPASDPIEVPGPLGRASYVFEELETRIAPQPRDTDPGVLSAARAYVQKRPKDVGGNLVPWNFPFDFSLGWMVETLAAGNCIIVKAYEYIPACAALLAEMIAATLAPRWSLFPKAVSTWRARSRPHPGTTCSILTTPRSSV